MTFGADEHSMEGSAYLAEHGPGAARRFVAMVNVEKIGRVPDHPLIMAGCSTSAAWTGLLEKVGGDARVECVLPELVPDTDHYAFAAMAIPAITLGTAHEEDTHQPTDEVARIDAAALARRARYVAAFVEALAAMDPPPAFEAGAVRGAGVITVAASAAERARLGLKDAGALKVGVVFAGLCGDAAGLARGDFVTAVNGGPLPPDPNERVIHETLIEKGSVIVTVRRGGVEAPRDLTLRCGG